MDISKQLTKFQKTAVYFFVYAFLGWIGEEVYCLISTHEFVKRGFLFGPICPIYGYGAIIIMLFFQNYKKNPIKLFLSSMIILTTFEYVTDFFLQALFGIRWWDYSNYYFNINGRITLSFSLLWGFCSLFFIKVLHPFVIKITGKILAKIPFQIQHIAITTALVVMFIDTLISSIYYIEIF